MKKKQLYWEDTQKVAQMVQSLDQDNISICTTDTVLGLLAKVSEEAFLKLNAIKGRSEKPYLLLISSKRELFNYVLPHVADCIGKLVMHCWPGPLTLIFEAKPGLPYFAQSQSGTVALRNPDHAGLLAVMENVGPLFSTSANLTGQPVPTTIDHVNESIFENVDLIILDQNKHHAATPSTILDCTSSSSIRVVREGSYSIEALEKICNKKFSK